MTGKKLPETVSPDPAFAADVIAGLSGSPKRLQPRWLYDEAGSVLFEEITHLDEYYPARTEALILERHGADIADFIGPRAALVEYGSGSSRKTIRLLERLAAPAAYIPVDISEEMLAAASAEVARRFPQVETIPLVADFMLPFDLPETSARFDRRAGFFPGSTIGNLSRAQATALLKQMRRHLGGNGRAVIGFDLVKDVGLMTRAYDDARGITAAFNRNILARINRELGADFDLSRFAHEARWNAARSRIEMHLVSVGAQTATLMGQSITFADGETIHTESSRKYDPDGIRHLAEDAGWRVHAIWTDPDRLFAVAGLTPAPDPAEAGR